MNGKSDQDLFERVLTSEEKERARLWREAHPEPPKNPQPLTTLTGTSKKHKRNKPSSKTGTRTKKSPGTAIEGDTPMNTNTPKSRQGRAQDPSPLRVFTVTSKRAYTACNNVGATVAFNDKDGDRYQTTGEFRVKDDGSGVYWHEFATEPVLTANEAAVEAAKAE